jgi:hypothetical protein
MPDKQIMHCGTFGKLLTDRGIGKRRDNENRYRTGIDLKKKVTIGVVTEWGHKGITSTAVHNTDELATKTVG